MKQENKKIGIIVLVLILIVGAAVYLPDSNLDITTLAYETNNLTIKDSTASQYGTLAIIQGQGEVTPQGNYLSTWLRTGEGEKIILTPHIDFWSSWYQGALGGNLLNQPGALIGRYWITGTFKDSTGSHSVIFPGGYDNNYLEVCADSPTITIYPEFGAFGKRPFPNIYGQYKTAWGSYGTALPSIPDGWNKWWTSPFSTSYTQYTGGISGCPVAFYMKSGITGTMTINVIIEYATWQQSSPFVAKYTAKTAIVQTDTFVVKSAEGSVDVSGTNSYRFEDPGAKAGGTQEVYTKYVFQEGKQVTLNIETDYSRPESNKGWKLQVLKGGNMPFLDKITLGTQSVTPDSNGYVIIQDATTKTATFTIPDGSFISGGNNEWQVKLINPALGGSTPQAEIKLFVVDTYDHVPSGTTMTVSSSAQINKALSISFSAYGNQITKSPITSFRIWGRWNNMVSGEYAFDTSVTGITVSGQKYSGIYTYTPTRTGTLYIQAHAVDAKAYTGGEATATVKVTAAPIYEFAVTVQDSVSNIAISGATVIFGSTSKTTTSTGYLTFDVNSGNYQLIVSAPGYQQQNLGIIQIGSNTQRTVKLISTDGGVAPPPDENETGEIHEYILTVTVTSNGGAVEGATIQSSGISQITDAFGVAAITVPSGSQTLSVSAEGYELYTELIDVIADTPWDVTLTHIESPTPPGGTVTITVAVITTTSLNIEGATVQIGSVTGTTTADGVAILAVPSTTEAVDLTVSKPGYTSFTNVLYPSTDMEFTVALKQAGGLGIPGFEMMFVILAIGIVMITIAYRKKRK